MQMTKRVNQLVEKPVSFKKVQRLVRRMKSLENESQIVTDENAQLVLNSFNQAVTKKNVIDQRLRKKKKRPSEENLDYILDDNKRHDRDFVPLEKYNSDSDSAPSESEVLDAKAELESVATDPHTTKQAALTENKTSKPAKTTIQPILPESSSRESYYKFSFLDSVSFQDPIPTLPNQLVSSTTITRDTVPRNAHDHEQMCNISTIQCTDRCDLTCQIL